MFSRDAAPWLPENMLHISASISASQLLQLQGLELEAQAAV